MGMMINRRRVYGGKNLPYDYEVEYIQFNAAGSDKTADLRFYGLPADGYLTLDLTVNEYGNFNSYPICFSSQVQNVNSNWRLYRTMLYTDITQKQMCFEKGSSNYVFSLTNPKFPYLVNIQLIRYHIKPNEDGTPTKYFIIGGGCPTTYRTFKIYDLNQNLVFDAIPVSVNGVGQLYDRISGKLGKSTGNMDFIAGPRVS